MNRGPPTVPLLPAGPRLRGILRWVAGDDSRSKAAVYGLAVALVAAATGLRGLPGLFLEGLTPTFVLFLGAVVAAAFLAGIGPALLATGLSLLAANVFFAGEPFAVDLAVADVVVAAVFGAEGAVIALFGGRMWGRLRRLVDREAEISRLYEAALAKEAELTRANEALCCWPMPGRCAQPVARPRPHHDSPHHARRPQVCGCLLHRAARGRVAAPSRPGLSNHGTRRSRRGLRVSGTCAPPSPARFVAAAPGSCRSSARTCCGVSLADPSC